MAKQVTSKKRRVLRFRILNRDFFRFLVFVLIATAFWFLQAFKEIAHVTVNYDIELVNVPKDVIITSDVPNTVSVTISGRGFDFFQDVVKFRRKVVYLDFADMGVIRDEGSVKLDSYQWKRAFTKVLSSGLSFVSCSLPNLQVFYCTGQHKRVPVRFNGHATAGKQHVLCGMNVNPEYVDIYAPSSQFDTITAVFTQSADYLDLEDTITTKVALQKINGVKIVPDSANLRINVDLFTDKTLDVPIYCEDIPQNKILRTFPLNAKVSFHVSASAVNRVVPRDFLVVVNYNSIKPGDKKCRLVLRSVPETVSDVVVSPEYVDYVIEQTNDE